MYYRGVSYRQARRRRHVLVRSGRLALVLWTVAVLVGLVRPPGERGTSSPNRLAPASAEAAQSNAPVNRAAEDNGAGAIPLSALPDLNGLRLPKATPLAFLNSTTYALDRTGRLVAPEVLVRRRDLPVISCAKAHFDPERCQVLTSDVLEALQFLDVAHEVSPALFSRISQVLVDAELGPILFLENSALPVLVGRGHSKRKVAYLATVLRHLDGSQGLASVKLLDLRFDGQVVARMESAS